MSEPTMTNEEIDALELLETAATEGEWFAASGGGYVSIGHTDASGEPQYQSVVDKRLGSIFHSCQPGNDFRLIAETRNALPALLAAARRKNELETEVAELRELVAFAFKDGAEICGGLGGVVASQGSGWDFSQTKARLAALAKEPPDA